MEELSKLDSVDIRESKEYVWRLQKRLNGARDLVLLGELVDYHFATSSKRALKVLTSLKSVHAQVSREKAAMHSVGIGFVQNREAAAARCALISLVKLQCVGGCNAIK